MDYRYLSKQFNQLMKLYDLDIFFDGNTFENKGNYSFTLKDLSNENINLINTIYHEDFINFGYEKL